MTTQKKGKSLLADLSLIIVALIWGSGFIATQYAIDSQMSASMIMALRFSIASLAMVVFFFKSILALTKSDIFRGLPAGILLFLAFFAQTIGLKYTTPSNNAFITSTNVIMVPFITWILLRKAPRLKSFILATVCLQGILLLTWSPGKGIVFNKGDLLTLLCAFLFACHISYLDVASKKVDVRRLTFIQMFTAAILSILTLMVLDPASVHQADFSNGLFPVLYLGLFSTCLCFLIQTAAQKKTTSTKAALFLSTECLFGSFLSVLLGLEPLTGSMILGGSIIMTAIVLSEIDWKNHWNSLSEYLLNIW